jgi:glycosyltransferase involved in cell wall biosynthesis
MKIAILGTRGIPANYGGFETFAEELATRLVTRGHDVTVYGRPAYVPASLTDHKGVRLVTLPTIRHKYLDTIVHTGVSTLHTLFRGYDVVLVCNAANALFCLLPRLAGTKVALNVDGIERKRKKWNAFGRGWYLVSEKLATWFPDSIVTDALVIQHYYADSYGAASTFIPYGCHVGRDAGRETLDRFGLQPDSYFLYVSRLEPENNAHRVIAAYEQTNVPQRLVVVGDAPYAREYIDSLRKAAGPRVLFTGGVYGAGYRELQCHALAYIHATEVGGTHPALVEAMGFGNCTLVHDVPENREVVSEAGLFFDAHDTGTGPGSLAAWLTRVAAEPDLVADYRQRAESHARAKFSWERVTDQYETLFRELCPHAPNVSPPRVGAGT